MADLDDMKDDLDKMWEWAHKLLKERDHHRETLRLVQCVLRPDVGKAHRDWDETSSNVRDWLRQREPRLFEGDDE